MPSAGKDNSSQNQLEKEAPLAGSLADRNAAVPGRGFTDECVALPSKLRRRAGMTFLGVAGLGSLKEGL